MFWGSKEMRAELFLIQLNHPDTAGLSRTPTLCTVTAPFQLNIKGRYRSLTRLLLAFSTSPSLARHTASLMISFPVSELFQFIRISLVIVCSSPRFTLVCLFPVFSYRRLSFFSPAHTNKTFVSPSWVWCNVLDLISPHRFDSFLTLRLVLELKWNEADFSESFLVYLEGNFTFIWENKVNEMSHISALLIIFSLQRSLI